MKRFFMRFNLQNGVGHFPATAALGAALQHADPTEIQEYLDEFDRIQGARAAQLQEKMGGVLAPLKGKKVLFFGDSITSDNLGYRETVCRAAELIGVDASVSGGTSATALQLAYTALKQARPDAVSIMLGTNDSVFVGREDFPQVSLAEYERNLRAILTWSREMDARILLLAVPPIHKERFDRSFAPQSKYQTPENVERYNAVLAALAEEFGIPLLRHEFADPNLAMEKDGIHLSCAGHTLLAERWLEMLTEAEASGKAP